MKYLYNLLVKNNQKAYAGFIVSALLSFLTQYGIYGDMKVSDALTALATGVLAGFGVYFTRNK